MEALYWEVYKDKKVKCFLCPHECVIEEGKTGRCRTRKNIDGKLFSLTYGKFTSISLDPIEKKPLYHFYPGREILSVGTFGCNFFCPWCQNFEISQADERVPVRSVKIEELISFSKRYNSIGISYTYNEPLINYEFVLDCSKKFNDEGMKNILVTNGYINEAPLHNLIPYIDGANVDLKSFNNDFYKKYCFSKIGPVLRTIETLFKKKKHIEITLLVIPKLNDNEDEFKDLVDWIWSLSPDVPLHLSRYYPAYKFNREPTPLKTLYRLRDIAIKKLKFVYLGNVWEEEYSNSYCPNCKAVLVRRRGYNVKIENLSGNICKNCGEEVNFLT
ncbi:MAG: AmmeMemoRadiSam system radical SAM enzyme [Caldiserica bacterium]|nr:MAG: AmmeMemoRadiSam system radical SAM enzyme [Caldisericota bacterium]